MKEFMKDFPQGWAVRTRAKGRTQKKDLHASFMPSWLHVRRAASLDARVLDDVGDDQLVDDRHARNDAADDRVLAVETRARGLHDVELTVSGGRIAGVREAHRAAHVGSLLR